MRTSAQDGTPRFQGIIEQIDHAMRTYTRTINHAELYKSIHEGAGTPPLGGAAQAWKGEVCAAFDEVDRIVTKSLDDAKAAWQGQAADAMHASVSPMSQWAADTKTVADAVGGASEQQIGHFASVRDSMPPPVAVTATDNALLRGAAHLVGLQTDAEVQEQAHIAAAQEAQRVYQVYGQSTTGTTERFPPFPTAPKPTVAVDDGRIGIVEPRRPGHGVGPPKPGTGNGTGGTPGSSAASPAVGGTGAAPGRNGTSPGTGGAQPGRAPAGIGAGGSAAPGGTSAQGFTPPPLRGGRPGSESGPGGFGPGGSEFGPTGSGFDPSGGVGVGSVVPGTGGSAGTAAGSDTERPGKGSRAGAAEPGPGQSAARPGGPAAAPASRPDASAMPIGGAGGRGRGGEDTEHERPSWLVNDDETFWTSGIPKTAPPVIGAEPPEPPR